MVFARLAEQSTKQEERTPVALADKAKQEVQRKQAAEAVSDPCHSP